MEDWLLHQTSHPLKIKNLILFTLLISSCASTEKKSGPSTNIAAVGHLGFFLLSHLFRNYWADSNETWLFCSTECLILQASNKIGVRRQIWLFNWFLART